VLDAPASNTKWVLSRDTCVSSTQLSRLSFGTKTAYHYLEKNYVGENTVFKN
jgi:hypothetical protein